MAGDTSNDILEYMAKELGIDKDAEVAPLVLDKAHMEIVCRMIVAFKKMTEAGSGTTEAPAKRGPGRPRKVA